MYLLGTQTLADVASGRDNAASRWYGTHKDRAGMFVSVMSFGLILQKIEELPQDRRGIWKRHLDKMHHWFEQRCSVLAVEMGAVRVWAEFYSFELLKVVDGKTVPAGEGELLVAATAIARSYSLVDERQPYHNHLCARQGLSLIDLSAGWP